MKKNILKVILYVIVDQIVKLIVVNTLGKTGKVVSLIPKLISLNYVENEGAAFGILLTRILLIALDVIIIFAIIKLLTSKKYEIEGLGKKGLLLVLGGGIGNLVDRISRGYVVDYFDITAWLDFPIFNIADIFVVVGILLMFITILINTIKAQEMSYEKNNKRIG